MLPNHAPLAVAEQFALLEAAHPNRIDLGIGRAPGSDPVTSMALRGAAGRDDSDIENFPQYLDDVMALMGTDGVRVTVPRQNYCPLYTSDAADDLLCVDLRGRTSIQKKNLSPYLHNDTTNQ